MNKFSSGAQTFIRFARGRNYKIMTCLPYVIRWDKASSSNHKLVNAKPNYVRYVSCGARRFPVIVFISILNYLLTHACKTFAKTKSKYMNKSIIV
jgi:hypothetical protein